MSKVILICGKICGGKSYYAKHLKEQHNAVILSTDEVKVSKPIKRMINDITSPVIYSILA